MAYKLGKKVGHKVAKMLGIKNGPYHREPMPMPTVDKGKPVPMPSVEKLKPSTPKPRIRREIRRRRNIKEA